MRGPRVTSAAGSQRLLLAKIFASQPPVRDPGAAKRGSCGLEDLPGVGIRGPGPMGRGLYSLPRDPRAIVPERCSLVPRGCLTASNPTQRLSVTAPRTERHGPWPHCSRAARHASPTAFRSLVSCSLNKLSSTLPLTLLYTQDERSVAGINRFHAPVVVFSRRLECGFRH